MRPSRGASYTHVQGLSRGLALLHALNRAPKGWARIAELSAETGLHRTTVRRLLETLQDEGYVRRSASDDSYRLNHKIRQLSDGFTDDEWISEIANPVLGELLKKLVWPSDLCTLDGDDPPAHSDSVHQRRPRLAGLLPGRGKAAGAQPDPPGQR